MSPAVFARESRATLVLAVPIMAGQLSQMLMGVLDSAMVGKVGVVPLAASAFANNLAAVPIVFGMGLLTCLSVLVSQAQGAGKRDEIGEILRHGLTLAFGVGALLTLFMVGFSFFLGHFGQPVAVAREAKPFFLLISLSVIPALLGLGLKQFCEALNDPWPPTLFLLAAVPLNAAINWVLIYGNLGFPALGLAGAGIGTLLARIASLLVIWLYLRSHPRFADVLPRRWRAPLDGKLLKDAAKIGVPSGVHFAVEVAAFSVGAILVGWIGADALAAHQIAFTCSATTFMLPLGVSMATTIQVGNALGARENGRVAGIGWSSMLLGSGLMALMALLFAFFGRAIAGEFVNETAVIALAAQILVIAAIFQIFDGVQITLVGALRGLSDTSWPMAFSLVGYWFLGLPFGYYLAFPRKMGALGIWIGLALGLGIVAVSLSLRFAVHARKLAREA